MAKNFTFKKYLIIAVALGSLLWLLGVFNFFTAEASGGYDLDGYAWSNNIGWISMNCKTGGIAGEDICATSNYKVSVNENGNIFGYAWSNNIGWIRFGGLSGFPTAPGNYGGNAKVNGNILDGWARACAGTNSPLNRCGSMGNNPNSGGWDGWISLKGTNYGVNLNTPANSYAWGSDVVGWIDMSLVRFITPTILNGTTCDIAVNESNCNGSINWNIDRSYNQPQVFNENTSISTSRTGTNFDVTLKHGSNIIYAKDSSTVLKSVTLTANCLNGSIYRGGKCIIDPTIRPIISISTTQKVVRTGAITPLTWSIPNEGSSCEIKGPGIGGLGVSIKSVTSSGNQDQIINYYSTYTLTCTGEYGTVSDSVSIEVIPSATEV